MLFNSIQFGIFFIIVTAVYFMMSHEKRWILLLAASCYFYMAFVPIYILILAFTILIDFVAGIYIEESSGRKRKMFLVLSLVANIGVLAIFKYYNFINDNLSFLLQGFGFTSSLPYLSILLPVGLSFHTFQAMSYTIEIYRGNQKAERHFGIYSLYVMFYPQLVAGPIERPQNLIKQFKSIHVFEYHRVVSGLKLMLWGLFKKVVVADRLAIYVDTVYNHTDQHTGITLALATVFFAFQIYCDFSGYSDIAIGAARVMGFSLMYNFNRPYFAQSIAEFWRRWHISLSTWFKDYLYFSLGGNRVSVPRWFMNLLLVFVLSGLWHGANWTFVVWGALNGVYLIVALVFRKAQNPNNFQAPRTSTLSKAINVVVTFTLICFTWIFFRADNINEAFVVIRKIVTFQGPIFIENPSMMIYSFVGIFVLMFAECKQEYYSGDFSFLNNRHWAIRALSYSFLIIVILLFGVFDGGQFIYFQF